jgi:hypothetical protein
MQHYFRPFAEPAVFCVWCENLAICERLQKQLLEGMTTAAAIHGRVLNPLGDMQSGIMAFLLGSWGLHAIFEHDW